MKKKLLYLLVILLLLGGGVWWYVATHDPLGDVPVPPVQDGPPSLETTDDVPPDQARIAELRTARRTCAPGPLDTFIAEQEARVGKAADPVEKGVQLHVLAEALLERVYLANSHIGLRVGKPMYSTIPPAVKRDITAGLDALRQARKLGVVLGDGHRVEAGLRVSRITGSISAMGIQGTVNDCYKRALEANPKNARLHVALGCRKLLAPRLLGQDLEKAKQHLEYACSVLEGDERPRVFAGMAEYLLGDKQAALAWVADAVATNPNNPFANTVLERLRAGEKDPFGRDL